MLTTSDGGHDVDVCHDRQDQVSKNVAVHVTLHQKSYQRSLNGLVGVTPFSSQKASPFLS
jgi:hypothetical protein